MRGTARDAEAKRRVCEAYNEALSRGQNLEEVIGFLAAQENVGRPAIWKRLRAGGVLSPYTKGGRPKKPRYKRQDGGTRLADVPAPIKPRDPCPRCGTRGDLNCGHSQAPLSMGL